MNRHRLDLDKTTLRARAEAALALRQSAAISAEPENIVEMQRLLHELQVHQIELELQNDALQVTQDETHAALQQVTDIKCHLEELVNSRTRELLYACDAAEAANRAKSVFLANMSHELRTPMNGFMGMVELALRGVTDPKVKDQLTKALSSAQRLLGVINDILDISKIEAGKLALKSAPFNLQELLAHVTQTTAPLASAKGLTQIVGPLPPALPPLLLGDSLRLEQILLNLLGNAIKFTATGQVSVQVLLVGEIDDALELRFEVRDTGIGIAPEALSRLFSPFEQADGSVTRAFGGTGLGLAISKRLAVMMLGDIGVERQPDGGSLFWFSARLGKLTSDRVSSIALQESDNTAAAALRAGFKGTRVLLVDDDEISREVAQLLLESVELVVDVAKDGQEALERVSQTAYALILMDMEMPCMDGLHATRRIRELPAYAQVPILAMTANAFSEDQQRCLAAGMNAHIAKPVDPTSLFDTIRHWLRRSSGVTPAT